MLGLKEAIIITAAVVALSTAVGAYKVHSWYMAEQRTKWEVAKTEAVNAAAAATQAVCDENNKTTKDNAHALQLKFDATLTRYYKLLKYKPTTANPTAPTSAAGGDNDPTSAALPTLHITVPDWADIAKRNDDQASALVTLQDVVADIYRRNGQGDLLPAEYLNKEK